MNVLLFAIQLIALLLICFEAFKLFSSGAPGRPLWGWLGVALIVFSLMLSNLQLHPIAGTH